MLEIIWLIVRKTKYLVLVVLTTIVMFVLSYFLTVWEITGKSLGAYAIMSGWSFTLFSLFLSLVISVLFGVYLALVFARRRLVASQEIKNKLAGAGGLSSGLLAAGCPTCGAPLFALLGAPLVLFSLPFHGLELKALSIVLLWLSIYLLIENMQKQLKCSL